MMPTFDLILILVWIAVSAIWIAANQHNETRNIMAKLSTLTSTLAAIEAQLTKDKSEIIAKVSELTAEIKNLQDIIAAGDAEIPAEAQSSLDKIAAIAKEIDDLNPDAPAVPPTP